jgi:glycosyltransferase involved in cell wall biosynthesis
VIYIFRPKIVHNVALKPALYGTLIARLFALQTVNAINGFGYIFTSNHLKAKILKPFVKLALKLILNHKSVRVLVQNTQDFEDCQSLLPKAKISLILGSGVDTKTFFPVSHDGVFTFTLVARMLWSKGVGEFVDAAKIFKKLYPAKQVRFLLVVSPDEQNPESIPLDTLKTWHAEAVVEWREYEEDIQSIYAQSNVAVLPSYREGMSKSLLEAMACGLPIITSDARGCADIVSEGNGIKVPVKNVDALTNAFDVLFSDFDLVQKLGLQSRADAERLYCLGRINSAVIKLYKETQKNSE